MRAKQIWLIGAAAVLAVAVVAVMVARSARPTTPTGDIAVIESYTIQASSGHLLVGPYSRFQWHHPGPAYFYALAPFYLASDRQTAGLNAGAVAINLLMIALAILAAAYGGGPVFAIAAAAAASLLVFRAEDLISSAWNPHVVVLPMMVTALACAGAATGRSWLLPVAAFAASFAAQTHVGTLPALALLGVAASIVVTVRWARGSATSRSWKPIALTVLVVFVMWLPSMVEQISGRPGNISALWNFFSSGPDAGQTFHTAFVFWASMMAGVVRPDFHLARGVALRIAHSSVAQGWAIGEMVLLALVATAAFLRGRRFELFLAGFLLVASLAALWSAMRVVGDLIDHEIFWISALGALNGAVVIAAGVRAATPSGARLETLALAVCSLLFAACAARGLLGLKDIRDRSFVVAAETNPILRAAGGVRDYLQREGVERPFVDIDQKSWAVTAGVLLQLQKSGVRYAVDDDWLPMFTDVARATGQERLVLSIAGPDRHVQLAGQPGVVPVLVSEPIYVDAYGSSAKR